MKKRQKKSFFCDKKLIDIIIYIYIHIVELITEFVFEIR